MTATQNHTGPAPARMRFAMSMYAINSMPQFAHASLDEKINAIKDAGYHGIQFFDGCGPEPIAAAREAGLEVTQSGRVNVPADADTLAERLAGEGATAATIHLGWGFEDDDEGARLIEAVLAASQKHKLPIYPETHRATLLQDMWRTLQFLGRFPELYLNADFSHWYTGAEMVYGDFDHKLQLLQPAMERVRFMHGRISDPGCMEACVNEPGGSKQSFVEHFKQMWTAAYRGFLKTAPQDAVLTFSPELLAADIFYTHLVSDNKGNMVEPCDRWTQSHLHCRIAAECFAVASRNQ